MNSQFSLVFDFETDSVDPHTCNIVQLAAIPVEARRLKILDDQYFSVKIRPDHIENEDYWTEERIKTLRWHCKIKNRTEESIIEEWKNGIEERAAWEDFIKYTKNYHSRKSRGSFYTVSPGRPQPGP